MRDYSTRKWKDEFSKLAKKGGKGALQDLEDRPAYSAYWRRNPKGSWKNKKKAEKKRNKKKQKKKEKKKKKQKKERKTKVVSMLATPSRKQLFTTSEVNQILKVAAVMVKTDPTEWTPVSKNPNHVLCRVREAFSEAAFREGINPSHLKGLSPMHYAPSNVWFRQVAKQSFETKKGVKPMGEKTRKTMRRCFNALKDAVEANERNWELSCWVE